MGLQLERFGPFVLLRPLGKGGMGVVYLAQTELERHPIAAVKRLRPDVANISGFAERFWHEGELARRLQHPGIVETLDVGEVDGVPYVASSFIVGRSIAGICDRLGELELGASVAIVARVLIEALGALAYMHDARDPSGRPLELVHRDITPGNLLVGYDGRTRLADFGLAKSFLTERLMLTGEGMILGTPRYLAPEIVRGERATRSSDIYGLGAVAYRMLAAVAPYEGDVREVVEATLRGPPRALRDLRPDVPEWMASFIERMMHREISARPNQAEVLQRQLQQLARTHQVQLSQEQVGAWLRDLLREESATELAEVEELIKSRGRGGAARVEATRVITPPAAENDGARWPRSAAEELTRVGNGSAAGESTGLGSLANPSPFDLATDARSVPNLGAATPNLTTDSRPPGRALPNLAPDTRSVPNLARAVPKLAIPPTVSLEPRTLAPVEDVELDRTRKPDVVRDGVPSSLVIAAVALFAALIGIGGGWLLATRDPVHVVQPDKEGEVLATKLKIAARIEAARRVIAERRARGQALPREVDSLSSRIDGAIDQDRWPQAQLLVFELETALTGTSTSM